MTDHQLKLLRIISRNNGLPIDAEYQMGLDGAAFWSVFTALVTRKLIDEDDSITALGGVALLTDRPSRAHVISGLRRALTGRAK